MVQHTILILLQHKILILLQYKILILLQHIILILFNPTILIFLQQKRLILLQHTIMIFLPHTILILLQHTILILVQHTILKLSIYGKKTVGWLLVVILGLESYLGWPVIARGVLGKAIEDTKIFGENPNFNSRIFHTQGWSQLCLNYKLLWYPILKNKNCYNPK